MLTIIIKTETVITRIEATIAREILVNVVEKIFVKSITAKPFKTKFNNIQKGTTKPKISGIKQIIKQQKQKQK